MTTTALTVRLSQMPAQERSDFLEKVLEEYQAKNLEEIAAQRNMSGSTLCRYLLQEKPEQWAAAKAAKSVIEYEAAERELQTADDMLKMNRAERRIRSAQWLLERLGKNIFAGNAPMDAAKVQININLRREPQEEGVFDSGAQ